MSRKSQAHNPRRAKTAPSYRVKYDALIECIGEGLIVINAEGNIERVNRYAAQSLGVTEADLLGRWFPGAVVIVDDYGQTIDPINRPMTHALTEGKAISEYANFRRPDGQIIPVFITASPIIIDGRPAGAIEVFRDLTSERELEVAQEEFVMIASHQLRTPATGTRSILSMILAGDFGELTPTQRRYIQMAARSNDRQLNIIEDLLSVARADSGSLELTLSEICLTTLISTIISEHELRLAEQNQQLKVDLAPGVNATVDGEKIKMVVDNLINNAAKYTPSGGTIRVELSQKGEHAQICVRDDGVGIPPDKLDLIFTKFMRVENELSLPAGGSGLGLYLAQKIIKLHGGSITVDSALGKGSKFCIMLPLSSQEANDAH